MKKLTYILTIMAVAFMGGLLSSCSEDMYSDLAVPEGEPVTLTLKVKANTPKKVEVNTRAAIQDDDNLNNLMVFIFDRNGRLKGFREFGQNELVQDGSVGTINLKTTTGRSYIYAIANWDPDIDRLYEVKGLEDLFHNKDLTEDNAAAGNIDFTLDQYRQLEYARDKGTILISSGLFFMSGEMNGGEAVHITTDGSGNGQIVDPTAADDQMIKLRRIVARNIFTVKCASDATKTRSFTLMGYDLFNIPIDGRMTSGHIYQTKDHYEDFTAQELGTQDKDEQGNPQIVVYLPENLQTAKNPFLVPENSTAWAMREKDTGTGSIETDRSHKTFVNAPDNGTYLVLHGMYSETEKATGTRREADVLYYIHLGNMSLDPMDFNVNRNWAYNYNITVNGVNSIKVEVEAEDGESPQPGAEGFVMEYTDTRAFVLDSHYEFAVMRFKQTDIQKLVTAGKGYIYQASTINGTTPNIMVTDQPSASHGSVDINWIKFVEGGTYSDANSGRGKPVKYPGDSNTMDIETLLKELYANANTDSYWDDNATGGRGSGYKVFTCFVDENYYTDKPMKDFVNAKNRTFIIANDVKQSKDERSTYATVAYSIMQRPIYTFYNLDPSVIGDRVIYGTESTSEDKKGNLSGGNTGQGDKNQFNGRVTMVNNFWEATTWRDYDGATPGGRSSNVRFDRACLSRNRDVDGDGYISGSELKWYTPSAAQLGGLWVGENALPTVTRLYTGTLANLKDNQADDDANERMQYFTNTSGQEVFWSEEGMATGPIGNENALAYVRCVRSLKSNDTGNTAYEATDLSEYYTSNNSEVDLSLMSDNACAAYLEGELGEHTERDAINKPAKKFRIAASDHGTGTLREILNGSKNCTRYSERGTYTSGWRVPNQRELIFMYLINASGYESKGCKTGFTNSNYRKGYTISNGILNMGINLDSNLTIRCVHDVAQ